MNIEKQQLWSTTIFNYKLENLDNDLIGREVLAREKQGKGFQFNPVQGGGWQSNKSLLGGVDSYATSLESLRKKILASVNKILSENTGKSVKTIEKDTNRDNFMSAEVALEYGLIDQIVTSR